MPRPGRVLISEAEIRSRIVELGQELARDYRRESPILVGVLQGAFLFMADLVRATPIELTTDFIGVSSYGGSRSSGHVRILSDLSMPIEGRDVVIVEDIVDTGLTLNYLVNLLKTRGPRSLKVVALLSKPARRLVSVHLDYVGFTIEDEFVVGYGLDYNEKYRNLRDIVVYGA